MRYEFPVPDEPVDPSWWAPLEGVACALQGQRRYQLFDIGDFMLMVKLVRPPRPSLYLDKHRYTRRYPNLDETGHAYRHAVPRSKPDGPSLIDDDDSPVGRNVPVPVVAVGRDR